MVKRSKLETYLSILNTLAKHSPLKLTHIMYEVNVNCSMLKEYLVFLVKQDLVEERTFGERRVKYAITQKGMNVLNYFKELQCALPITEEPIDGAILPL